MSGDFSSGDNPFGPVSVSEEELRTADLPTIEYVGGIPMFPIGGVVVLYGDPGLGKSFVTQALFQSIAWGKPLGPSNWQVPKLSNCLYVDFEGTPSLAKERSLLLSPEDPPARATDTRWLFADFFKGKSFPERLSELEAELGRQETSGIPYSLVAIDTLTAFIGANPGKHNAYDFDVQAMQPLLHLAAKYQICIVLISHPNKGGTLTGSVGRSGSAWMVLKFEATEQDDDGFPSRARLFMEKNRVGEQRAFYFTRTQTRTWRLESDMPPCAAHVKGNSYWFLHRLTAGGPATKTELIRDSGLGENTVKRTLQRLREHGLVRVERETWRWSTTFDAIATPQSQSEPVPADTPPPQEQPRSEPELAVRARPTDPADVFALDYSGFDPQDPKKSAIKASMRLMKQSVQRAGARYKPALYLPYGPLKPEEVWEGRVKWQPQLADDECVTQLDKNAAYLSAANTHLPIGPLTHDQDPEEAYRGKRAGYHLVDPAGFEGEKWLGGPFVARKEPGPVWIATPTIKAIRVLTGVQLPILESWTAPATEVLLRPWIEVLREERTAALEADDRPRYDFVKACYSLAISTGGESTKNWELRRPDWVKLIRAQAFANIWRVALNARSADLRVVKIGNTDELWLAGDGLTQHQGFHGVFKLGTGLGQWKVKRHWIVGREDDEADEAQAPLETAGAAT